MDGHNRQEDLKCLTTIMELAERKVYSRKRIFYTAIWLLYLMPHNKDKTLSVSNEELQQMAYEPQSIAKDSITEDRQGETEGKEVAFILCRSWHTTVSKGPGSFFMTLMLLSKVKKITSTREVSSLLHQGDKTQE